MDLLHALSWLAVVGFGQTTTTEGGGRAMATTVHDKEAYRAVTASKVGVVGGCEHGGVAVVMEEQRGRAGSDDGDGGRLSVLWLLWRVKKEGQGNGMVSAGQCGRVLVRLRRALACLGYTRWGAGDAWRPLASMRRASPDGVGH